MGLKIEGLQGAQSRTQLELQLISYQNPSHLLSHIR